MMNSLLRTVAAFRLTQAHEYVVNDAQLKFDSSEAQNISCHQSDWQNLDILWRHYCNVADVYKSKHIESMHIPMGMFCKTFLTRMKPCEWVVKVLDRRQ